MSININCKHILFILQCVNEENKCLKGKQSFLLKKKKKETLMFLSFLFLSGREHFQSIKTVLFLSNRTAER